MVAPNNLNGVVGDAFGYLASLAHASAPSDLASKLTNVTGSFR